MFPFTLENLNWHIFLFCALCTFAVPLGRPVVSSAESPAESPTYMTYSDLVNLSSEEVAQGQIKLLRIGPHSGGQVGPVLLWVSGYGGGPAKSVFKPFFRRDLDLSGESSFGPQAPISAAEFRAVVIAVGQLPAITSKYVEENDGVEFAVAVRGPKNRGFSAIVPRAEIGKLFQRLRSALPDQSPGSVAVANLACYLEVSDPVRPQKATTSTTVKFGEMRRDATTGHFRVTATITNTSAATLPNPLSLLMGGYPSNVEILERLATTCEYGSGWPYLNAVVPPDGLAPGASTDIQIEIDNPELEKFDFVTRVLVGPGAR